MSKLRRKLSPDAAEARKQSPKGPTKARVGWTPPNSKGRFTCTNCRVEWVCDVEPVPTCRRCRDAEVVRLCDRCRLRRANGAPGWCTPCAQAALVARQAIGDSNQGWVVGRHRVRKVM